ncbi:MAG: quinone-dependent dihydroorotate dehydrogenase [bacterium]
MNLSPAKDFSPHLSLRDAVRMECGGATSIVLYDFLRPLLFTLPAEAAHGVAFRALAAWQAVLERSTAAAPPHDALLSQTLWGLQFANPLGLAAGFDKNGALPHVWSRLGFGFAELGTVTALAQPGNPPPRVFRLAAERGLINRLGFNNAGAEAVARDLGARLAHARPPLPLGINLGKSKLTPLERAADDYLASLRALDALADYLVVNISSPNTPGLRDLQSEAQLAPLLAAVQGENRRLASARGGSPRPLLVKVAPDLNDEALASLVEVAVALGVAGLIATNTTIDRSSLPAGHSLACEAGGLSGAPLRARSTAVIRTLHRLARRRLPIVGVGGVFSGADAYEKLRAGASLVQAYSGFVYGGPGFAARVAAELRALLQRDGVQHIADVVGVDA